MLPTTPSATACSAYNWPSDKLTIQGAERRVVVPSPRLCSSGVGCRGTKSQEPWGQIKGGCCCERSSLSNVVIDVGMAVLLVDRHHFDFHISVEQFSDILARLARSICNNKWRWRASMGPDWALCSRYRACDVAGEVVTANAAAG